MGRWGAYIASSKCFRFRIPNTWWTNNGVDSINDNCVRTRSVGTAQSITICVVDGKIVFASWETLCDCWLYGVLHSERTTAHGTLYTTFIRQSPRSFIGITIRRDDHLNIKSSNTGCWSGCRLWSTCGHSRRDRGSYWLWTWRRGWTFAWANGCTRQYAKHMNMIIFYNILTPGVKFWVHVREETWAHILALTWRGSEEMVPSPARVELS